MITGKNNVGKTSLLEAIWLYADGASARTVRAVLRSRDELHLAVTQDSTSVPDAAEAAVESIQPLFTQFEADSPSFPLAFRIGTEDPMDELLVMVNRSMSRDITDSKQKIDDDLSLEDYPFISMDVRYKTAGFRIPLFRFLRSEHLLLASFDGTHNVYMVNSTGLSNRETSNLWDRIALTSKEESILQALRLIDDRIERVSVIGGRVGEKRVPHVGLSSQVAPVKLRQLGDGVNRLFGLVLAAVNVEYGILLIDEIENGLHYTVHKDVWKTIFDLANRLNVQVFATTHSWECIQAFKEALWSSDDNYGELIRLEQKSDKIVPTIFDKRGVKVVAEDWIEVR